MHGWATGKLACLYWLLFLPAVTDQAEPQLTSFVHSSGAAVGRCQYFNVPSAYRQRWCLDMAQCTIPL